MSDATIVELLESCRSSAIAEADQTKDSQRVNSRLQDLYRSMTPVQRTDADRVFGDWLASDDEARRFDATVLIGELRIRSARPALEELERRLQSDRSAGAPFEIRKIARVLAMLNGDPGTS